MSVNCHHTEFKFISQGMGQWTEKIRQESISLHPIELSDVNGTTTIILFGEGKKKNEIIIGTLLYTVVGDTFYKLQSENTFKISGLSFDIMTKMTDPISLEVLAKCSKFSIDQERNIFKENNKTGYFSEYTIPEKSEDEFKNLIHRMLKEKLN